MSFETLAAQLDARVPHFIDGERRCDASIRAVPVVSPIDGRRLSQLGEGDGEVVDEAVRGARRAFEGSGWASSDPADRKAALLRWAELLERAQGELSMLDTLDMGKPISESRDVDLPATLDCLRWYAEAADKFCDEVAPTSPRAIAVVVREPVGVVGAIVPWNYPAMLAMWKLAPALAAGNAVVLKPSEHSPHSALRMAELAVEAGLPPGVFNVAQGVGSVAGRALASHHDVNVVAFTGSTATGRHILRYAADSNLKRVYLECGGKSPNIILPDAPDLAVAVENAADAIFANQGEVCSAASRLIVHEDIADEVIAMLVGATARSVPGDPRLDETRMGALVSVAHRDRVDGFVKRALGAGASVACGARAAQPVEGGAYYCPTVLVDVTNDMEVAREEIFGPVLSVIRVRDLDEAIRVANDTRYGLAAGIWTSNLSAAMRASREIRAGSVWVNGWDGLNNSTPFGGVGESGNGRDLSRHAIHKYTELKSIWINP